MSILENPFISDKFIKIYSKYWPTHRSPSEVQNNFMRCWFSSDNIVSSSFGSSLIFDYSPIYFDNESIYVNGGSASQNFFKFPDYMIVPRYYSSNPIKNKKILIDGKQLNISSCHRYSIPSVDISGNLESYLASLTKKIRQEIRTTHNKIARNNLNPICRLITSRDDAYAVLDRMIDTHQERQKQKRGKSIFNEIKFKDFVLDLISEGLAVISVLYLSDEPASFMLLLESGNVQHSWIPCFDKQYANYGIGKYHIYSHLDRLFREERIKKFSFMAGDERYKHQFANRYDAVYFLTWSPYFLLSNAIIAAFKAIKKIKINLKLFLQR